jgi:hypothetical protein
MTLLLGSLALYFVVKPAKASFSIALTMVVCALAGHLIVVMFTARNRRSRVIATTITGLLLGLSISFRLPNLFLSAGPFLWLSIEAFKTRKPVAVLPLFIFGVAYLAGLTPTLVANTINAGSPFSTTHGPSDIVPLDLSFAIAKEYISDMQGVLIAAWFPSPFVAVRPEGANHQWRKKRRPRDGVLSLTGWTLLHLGPISQRYVRA